MTKPLFVVLPGDYSHACSPDLPVPGEAKILFVESEAFLASAHHRQKLALHLASARHFASALQAEGHDVEVMHARALAAGVDEAARESGAPAVLAQAPVTRRLQRALEDGARAAGVPLELLPERRFVASREEFAAWAKAAGEPLSVDAWYRDLRIRTGALMERVEEGGKKRRAPKKKAVEGGEAEEDAFAVADGKAKAAGLQPFGGRWIPSARKDPVPPREEWPTDYLECAPDEIARAAVEEVAALTGGQRETKTFPAGNVAAAKLPRALGEAGPFGWPTTPEQARDVAERFVRARLLGYHKLEDAMLGGHPQLYHSGLSAALNLGLLHPREVVARVDAVAKAGEAPPAAAEAFLRNLLGWREFAHGFYWYAGESYERANALGAERALPDFFDNPDYTSMNCVKQVVSGVLARGYAPPHHRLMVVANFLTLAGVDPRQAASWFERAFVDGVEWAALPLTLGLGTFADGGRFTPKPYVTAAAYVNKHSDYCGGCGYDAEARAERRACPFNYLYWNFVAEKEPLLRGNPKMTTAYRILNEFGDGARAAAAERAHEFFEGLLASQQSTEDDI